MTSCTAKSMMNGILKRGYFSPARLRTGSARLFWKSRNPSVPPPPVPWELVYRAVCFTALALLLAPIALLGTLYLPGAGSGGNQLLRCLESVAISALFLLPLLVTGF